MTEGKLKERLFRELDKYRPDREIHCELSAVGIWLDEAKKEFPCTFEEQPNGATILRFPTNDLDKSIKSLRDWFFKYFGDMTP